jgi:hypothetical protein
MGASVSANIPEDLEWGCIETTSHTAAWCIAEMCSPWMDGSIEAEDFKSIPCAALRAANQEVPDTFWAYHAWRLEHLATWPDGLGRLWDIVGSGLYERAFLEARQFIRTYATSSTLDDAVFEI